MAEHDNGQQETGRTPERWVRPTPDVARFTVASVDSSYLNPVKVLRGADERTRIGVLLKDRSDVDLAPSARTLARQEIVARAQRGVNPPRDAQTGRWIQAEQRKINDKLANPARNPALVGALNALYSPGALPTCVEDIWSVFHERHQQFEVTDGSDLEDALTQDVITTRKSFIDRMVNGCRRNDGSIDMIQLREWVLAIQDAVLSQGILYATMTQGVLQSIQAAPDEVKEGIIGQVVAEAGNEPSDNARPMFALFAENAPPEPPSGNEPEPEPERESQSMSYVEYLQTHPNRVVRGISMGPISSEHVSLRQGAQEFTFEEQVSQQEHITILTADDHKTEDGHGHDAVGVSVKDGKINLAVADGVTNCVLPAYFSRVSVRAAFAAMEENGGSPVLAAYTALGQRDLPAMAREYEVNLRDRARAATEPDASYIAAFADRIHNFIDEKTFGGTTLVTAQYEKNEETGKGKLGIVLEGNSIVTVFKKDGTYQTFGRLDESRGMIQYGRPYSQDREVKIEDIQLDPDDVVAVFSDGIDKYNDSRTHKDVIENINNHLVAARNGTERLDQVASDYMKTELRALLEDDFTAVFLHHQGSKADQQARDESALDQVRGALGAETADGERVEPPSPFTLRGPRLTLSEVASGPDGESSAEFTPSPEVSRVLVASAAPRYWDPEKSMSPDTRDRLVETFREQSVVDLMPQARALARDILFVTPPLGEKDRSAYVDWITYHVENSDGNPSISQAVTRLSEITGETETAESIYDKYLRPPGVDEEELATTISTNRKQLIDAVIADCQESGDEPVDIAKLRGNLLTLYPILGSEELLWAAMAQGMLSQPATIREQMISQALDVASREQVSFGSKDILSRLERFSGPVEYHAAVKARVGMFKGEKRKYRDTGYVTPYGLYYPEYDYSVTSQQLSDASLDASLAPRSDFDQVLQAGDIATIFTHHVGISEEDILGLEGKMKDLIAEGKMQGFSLLAQGVGDESNNADIWGSLIPVLVTHYVINNRETEADTQKLLKDALIDANSKLARIKKVRERMGYPIGKGGASVAAVLTDAQGNTFTASYGDSRVYKRNTDTNEVSLLTSDTSEAWRTVVEDDTKTYLSLFSRTQSVYCINGSGNLPTDNIQVSQNNLSENEEMLLCNYGVWRYIDEPSAKERLDTIWAEAIGQGMPREEALKKTLGEDLSRKIAQSSDTLRLADYLANLGGEGIPLSRAAVEYKPIDRAAKHRNDTDIEYEFGQEQRDSEIPQQSIIRSLSIVDRKPPGYNFNYALKYFNVDGNPRQALFALHEGEQTAEQARKDGETGIDRAMRTSLDVGRINEKLDQGKSGREALEEVFFADRENPATDQKNAAFVFVQGETLLTARKGNTHAVLVRGDQLVNVARRPGQVQKTQLQTEDSHLILASSNVWRAFEGHYAEIRRIIREAATTEDAAENLRAEAEQIRRLAGIEVPENDLVVAVADFKKRKKADPGERKGDDATSARDADAERIRQQQREERLVLRETLDLVPGEEGGPNPQEAARKLLREGLVGAYLYPHQGKYINLVDDPRTDVSQITPVERQVLMRKHDLLQPSQSTEESVSFLEPLEDAFGIPPGDGSNRRSSGTLFIQTGEKNNAFVLQGGGNFGDSDASSRLGTVSFNVAFRTEEQQQYFLRWLAKDPRQALYSLFLPMHADGAYSPVRRVQQQRVRSIFNGIREIRMDDQLIGREYYRRDDNEVMIPVEQAMASRVQSVAMAGRFPNGVSLPTEDFVPAPEARILQDRVLDRMFEPPLPAKVLSFRNLLEQEGAGMVVELQSYDKWEAHEQNQPAYIAFSYMQEVQGSVVPVIIACAFSSEDAKQFIQFIKQSPDGASIVERFLRRVVPDHISDHAGEKSIPRRTPTKLFVLDEKTQQDLFGEGFTSNFGAIQSILTEASPDARQQDLRSQINTTKDNLRDTSFTDEHITTLEYDQESVRPEREASLGIRMGGETIKGDRGEVNEDAIWFDEEKGVSLVCDGMGGAKDGARAAQFVKKGIQEAFSATPEFTSVHEAMAWVKKQIVQINQGLDAAIKGHEIAQGAGTTLNLVYVWRGPSGRRYIITANLGDSRSSLVQDNDLQDLTLDNSLLRYHLARDPQDQNKFEIDERTKSSKANFQDGRTPEEAMALQRKFSEIEDSSGLTGEELQTWIDRNIILGAIDGSEWSINQLEVDYVVAQPGQRIVQRSDGTSDVTTNRQTAETMTAHTDPQEAAEAYNRVAQTGDDGPRKKNYKDDKSTIVTDVLEESVPVDAAVDAKAIGEGENTGDVLDRSEKSGLRRFGLTVVPFRQDEIALDENSLEAAIENNLVEIIPTTELRRNYDELFARYNINGRMLNNLDVVVNHGVGSENDTWLRVSDTFLSGFKAIMDATDGPDYDLATRIRALGYFNFNSRFDNAASLESARQLLEELFERLQRPDVSGPAAAPDGGTVQAAMLVKDAEAAMEARADLLGHLAESMETQEQQMDFARALFGLDPGADLPPAIFNTISRTQSGTATWEHVIKAAGPFIGRDLSDPVEARQTFIQTAQLRGSTLSVDQLNLIYDASLTLGRLIDFMSPYTPETEAAGPAAPAADASQAGALGEPAPLRDEAEEILAHIRSGEVTDEEMIRLAKEIAGEIRQQGMGYLHGKFPPHLEKVPRSPEHIQDILSFNQLEDIESYDGITPLNKSFGRNYIYGYEPPRAPLTNCWDLAIAPFGLEILPNEDGKRKQVDGDKKDWIQYSFIMPVITRIKRPGANVVMQIAVPPPLADKIDAAFAVDRIFMDRVFRSLFVDEEGHDYVGPDPEHDITRYQPTEIRIRDYRRVPDQDFRRHVLASKESTYTQTISYLSMSESERALISDSDLAPDQRIEHARVYLERIHVALAPESTVNSLFLAINIDNGNIVGAPADAHAQRRNTEVLTNEIRRDTSFLVETRRLQPFWNNLREHITQGITVGEGGNTLQLSEAAARQFLSPMHDARAAATAGYDQTTIYNLGLLDNERVLAYLAGERLQTPEPADAAGTEPDEPAADADVEVDLVPAGRDESGEQRVQEPLPAPIGEIIPTVEGDSESPVELAYFAWDPTYDFSQVARSANLKNKFESTHVGRVQMGEQPSLRYRITSVNGNPTPVISYSFRVRDEGSVDQGRTGLTAVLLAGERLTPELALRMVAIDGNGDLAGWLPGERGPINPRDRDTVNHALNVAELKQYQNRSDDRQAERVYERLQNSEVQERFIKLVTSLFERSAANDANNRLYMYNTDERDSHAMLYALFDMVSQTPSLRSALGPLSFCTNFSTDVTFPDDFQLNFSAQTPGRSAFGHPPDVNRRAPTSGIFADAARTLVTTFLQSNHDTSRIAHIVSEAGVFTPDTLEAWCSRIPDAETRLSSRGFQPSEPAAGGLPARAESAEPEALSQIQRAEQQAWQDILGVQVEIPPLPDYVTPEVRQELERLGMELRFIPHLDLSESSLRDKNVQEYLHDLSERYPKWKPYEELSESEKADFTNARNLSAWFWEQVKEEKIDFPILPGQWMAVETNLDLDNVPSGQSSALTPAMGLNYRNDISWVDAQAKLQQAKALITSRAGIDSVTVDCRLLTAIEWNLLANREGWGRGPMDGEWVEDEYREPIGNEATSRLYGGGRFRGASEVKRAGSSYADFDAHLRVAVVLGEAGKAAFGSTATSTTLPVSGADAEGTAAADLPAEALTEVQEAARRLASRTKQEGVGYITGRFPKALREDPNPLANQQAILGFRQGQELGPLGAQSDLVRIFADNPPLNEHGVREDNVGRHALVLAPYGLHVAYDNRTRRRDSLLETRDRSMDGFVQMEYIVPVISPDLQQDGFDRGYELTFIVAVPQDLITEFEAEADANSHFPYEYFNALFPNVIGNNAESQVKIKPANNLYIKDLRSQDTDPREGRTIPLDPRIQMSNSPEEGGEAGERVEDDRILARLSSGEISEDEMAQVAEVLARQTREQGMGYIHGKFPSRLDRYDPSEGGGGFQDIDGFDRGREIAPARRRIPELQAKFRGDGFDMTRPYNRDVLIVAPLGFVTDKAGRPVGKRSDTFDPAENDWTKYTYFAHIQPDHRDIRNAFVRFHVAVPPTIAKFMDAALTKDKTYMDKYCKALYPGYLGSDPEQFIARRPATEIRIIRSTPNDPMVGPDGMVSAKTTDETVAYPHELRDDQSSPARAEPELDKPVAGPLEDDRLRNSLDIEHVTPEMIRRGINEGLESLQPEIRDAVLRMVAPDITLRLQRVDIPLDDIRTRLQAKIQSYTDPDLPVQLASEINDLLPSPTDIEDVLLRNGIIHESQVEIELLRAFAPMLGLTTLDREGLISRLRSLNNTAEVANALKNADTSAYKAAQGDIPSEAAIARRRAKRFEKFILPQQEAIRVSVVGIPMEDIFSELSNRFGIVIHVPDGGGTVRALSEEIPQEMRKAVATALRHLGRQGQAPRTAEAASEQIGRLIVKGEIARLPDLISPDSPEVRYVIAKLQVTEEDIVNMKMLERRSPDLDILDALHLTVQYIPPTRAGDTDRYLHLYAAVANVPFDSLSYLYGIQDEEDAHEGEGITKALSMSPITDFLDVETNLRQYVGQIDVQDLRREKVRELRRREFERIEKMLLSNQLPGFIKDFVRFGLIYNNGKLADLVTNPVHGQTSPELEFIANRVLGINLSRYSPYERAPDRENVNFGASQEQKLQIARKVQRLMLNDILRVSVFSNNHEVAEFVGKLVDGKSLFAEYTTNPQSVMGDGAKREQLGRFTEICETLASLYSEGIGITPNTGALLQQAPTSFEGRVAQLCAKLQITEPSRLLATLERRVLGPIGYSSFEQLQQSMRVNGEGADKRNREFARNNRRRKFVRDGDLIKRGSDDLLPHVLRSGALAISLSGKNAIGKLVLGDGRPDNTPLDTDFTKITSDFPFEFALNLQMDKGDLIMVVKDPSKDPSQRLARQYEVYNARGIGDFADSHIGVRSGLPSSEVSAYIFQPNYYADPGVEEQRLQRIKFSLAQNSFYIPLYDADQQLIFTPEDYDAAQNKRVRESIRARAENNTVSARGFVKLIKEVHPYVRREFGSDAGVYQKFTIGQHTDMVVDRFEADHANRYPSDAPLPIGLLRAAVILHDIGKHEAIVLAGDKHKQHKYTEPFMRQLLIGIGLPSSSVEKMIALVNQDYIGEYIKKPNRENLVKAANGIKYLGKVFECSDGQMFGLLKILYTSDASSYIAPITGQRSGLDRYFTYDRATSQAGPTAALEQRFSDIDTLLLAA